MITQCELVDNPKYNPDLPANTIGNTKRSWSFREAGRDLRIGDVVKFLCNGRGRGGHYAVYARVTKVNRKTFKAIELPRSYQPGTNWTVNIAYALEPGNGGITIQLNWEE